MGVLLVFVLVYWVWYGIVCLEDRLVLFVMLIYIDGWLMLWYCDLCYVVYCILGMVVCMCVEEDELFGIKNLLLWWIIKVKFVCGDSFYYLWVLLVCIW